MKNKTQHKKMVLLVDDEQIVRAVANKMISKIGFSVIEASNGVEAVKLYQEQSDRIVLVLIDFSMPFMSGPETYKKLKEISRDVRAIFMSGLVDIDVIEQITENASFLKKPFSLDKLINAVVDVIE
jgi:two-component system, cell cycle sensor histidine kinase and response regulator CckA